MESLWVGWIINKYLTPLLIIGDCYGIIFYMSDKVTYFGETDFRNARSKFGIKNNDRSRHVYIIGKTGMGKSTVLENMAAQDIMNGEGMCFLDPHGSAIDVLIDYIPQHRVQDVAYFAPFDTGFPMSFNVLEHVEPDKRHLVVAGLMASFKKIWADSFSARMEYILSNTLLALLEYPGATLLGVNRMLAEKDYRLDVVKHITDDSVKAFWVDEYGKWDPRYAKEAGAAIQNKIGQFTSNPLIRNIIGQEKSAIDFREAMDNQKIILVNLSKGLIGESNGNLLGGMLITKLYLAAMSRADVGAGNLQKLPNFFFFVDEFQNFANESFADILSEARKYKLNLTVAHQYVDQMEEQVSSAIFGNVGTMITFRVGATDAEVFEKQFAPTFTAEDIVNLGKFQIYLSLMIDGIGSRPFSARTLAPVDKPGPSMREHVIAFSRANFAQPRQGVEERIAKWYEPIKKPERRSFRDQDSAKPGNTNSTGLKSNIESSKNIEKKTFVIDAKKRDTDGPLKKTFKEIEEKEAELEMKQVVSPRLNDLLDKMDAKPFFKDKGKTSIPRVVENIKKYESTSEPLRKTGTFQSKKPKTKIPESVIKKVSAVTSSVSQKAIQSGRGANRDTMSSLSDLLNKAIKDVPVTKKVRKQTVNNVKPLLVKKKVIDTGVDVSQKAFTNKKPAKENFAVKPKPQLANTQKEVPEDILRGLFK